MIAKKKLLSSLGRRPDELNQAEDDCSTFSVSQPKDSLKFNYQKDCPSFLHQKESIYCYLSANGSINSKNISTFIDNGASFNAIDPVIAKKLNLPITNLPNPLLITLGNNRKISIPRRITNFKLVLDGFKPYSTDAFVMSVPENKHILLGMPWLEEENPVIDWKNKTLSSRNSNTKMEIHQCVRSLPARKAGRKRVCEVKNKKESNLYSYLQLYIQNDYTSASGSTRIVPANKFKKLLKEKDNEFIFLINQEIDAEKVQRQKDQSWENIQNNPAKDILLKYKNTVFRTTLPSIPPSRDDDVEATIELIDKNPVARKQFPLSIEMKNAIREWTKEMLEANIIRPSRSPYCAPTFCVKKPIGWRIVHDFRAINAKMVVPANPIPRKDDIFNAMANGKLFSALDLLWGFFQVRLREKDIPYTAFATPDGLFEYLVTPMGLSGSPASFNRLIQKIFCDQGSFCQTYFDDIFVYTKTNVIEDHLIALDKVLKRCEEKELYVKFSKCIFCSTEIPCLGDFIGCDGIRMDPDKIRIIKEWPIPRTKQQMQSFIGTCVYVLKYCENFAELITPLTNATRNKTKHEKIQLSKLQLESFNKLKEVLSSPPVLAHPDFTLPFHVKMDASDFAIGGYLFQIDESGKEKIICYGGRKLSDAELIYPTREKELLASLYAMRCWKTYLIDKPFYINTDHQTIQNLLTQSTCS